MFPRFSVKKPFTTLVVAIAIIMVGIVAVIRSNTDLLPSMNMPYVAVITVEAGASPEQVENDATIPLEANLGRINGLKTMTSSSNENYSIIYLEFTSDTNIDSAMVKVSEAVNETAPNLPDTVSTPTLLELGMNLMATTYLGISYEGMDIYELSQFISETVEPRIERLNGVASISSTGLAVDEIGVNISAEKIDALNAKLQAYIDEQLAAGEAALKASEGELDNMSAQLADSQYQVNAGQAALDAAQLQVSGGRLLLDTALQATYVGDKTYDNIADFKAAVEALPESTAAEQFYKAQMRYLAQEYETQYIQLDQGQAQIDDQRLQLQAAQTQIYRYSAQLEDGKIQIDEAWEQLRAAKFSNTADLGSAISLETVQALLYAQNFSMPAGYIDDSTGTKWMLKVGDSFDSIDDIKNMVLFSIEGVGDITIDDVADIETKSSGSETFARINGQDAVLMACFKTSTAATSDVSEAIIEEAAALEAEYDGLGVTPLVDQGAYIRIFINTILKSLLLGALLAIVVLALFLRDFKPTIIIAISIPFSVLFAIVLMYFSNISINAMTLGALSLAIGMLVDNSVVVMENIYRLRERGLSSARAAVQGGKQVTGAIISSTLTTICVFLPAVFTTGTVRQLLVPFALTIAYALIASLLVALTVVPSLSSVLFKHKKNRERKQFNRVQNGYARSLYWCLNHRLPVLGVAILLLAGSIALALSSGVSMLPEMITSETTVYITTPEGTEQEQGDAMANQVMEEMYKIEGVKVVGGIDQGAETGVISTSLSSEGYTGTYEFYLSYTDEIKTERQVKEIIADVEAITDKLPEGTEVTVSSDIDMASLLGASGLTVKLSGKDNDELLALSKKVMDAVNGIEGYENVSNGQEDGDPALHLNVDVNAAARKSLTVAQIYAAVAQELQTSVAATSLVADGVTYTVTVEDTTNPLTMENILELEIANNDGEKIRLGDVATLEEIDAAKSIGRSNGTRNITVTADVKDGYQATDLAELVQTEVDKIDVPKGYTITVGGENDSIMDMLKQLLELAALGFVLIYLIMVAQFQSLLSPFIILFTVPLAFTGGMLGLWAGGQQITIMSMLGFILLMGTVVNNGIVLVDYINQLRLGGLSKRDAIVAGGRTRLRPILITALTTILSMCGIIFSPAIGSSLERGMAIVVAGGLLYATLMTLYVVPILYDLFYRRQPHVIDLGPQNVDDAPDDAQEFLAQLQAGQVSLFEGLEPVDSIMSSDSSSSSGATIDAAVDVADDATDSAVSGVTDAVKGASAVAAEKERALKSLDLLPQMNDYPPEIARLQELPPQAAAAAQATIELPSLDTDENKSGAPKKPKKSRKLKLKEKE